MWWNSFSGTVMLEQCRWNTKVEQWNSVGGTVWWNSGTVLEEQCGGTVEQCWRNRGQCWWNSGTVMDEQCGGTVEQSWSNTHSGKVKHQ